MAKYVFLNIPAYGHVNSTFPVVQELVRRGEEVVYYLTEEFRSTVEATGATFRSYKPFGKPPSPARVTKQEAAGGPTALPQEKPDSVYQILDRVRADQPDYIIYDALHMWARTIAQVLHLPAILSCPILVANEDFNPLKEHLNLLNGHVSLPTPIPAAALERIQAQIKEVCTLYNVTPLDMRDFYTHAEPLNIVFIPRAFHPTGELFDERFVFVDPSL